MCLEKLLNYLKFQFGLPNPSRDELKLEKLSTFTSNFKLSSSSAFLFVSFFQRPVQTTANCKLQTANQFNQFNTLTGNLVMSKERTSNILSTLIPNKTRLRDTDGFVATIRYIGPVASAKKNTETYVGVEWDDPHRGLHDGSVISRTTNELVRHFSLSTPSPTGGSFLRLNKIDTGVELNFKLIQSRYVDPDAPLVAPNNLLPFSARTSSGRDKPIEFLGELKVRKRQQLSDLDDISLRSMGVSSIATGDCEAGKELMNTFEHLKELDVSGNLFSDWENLLEILKIFPNLTWLSFASNKIYDIPSNIQWKDGGFERLEFLNLNKCSIASFRTVLVLDELCPKLQELCVAYSDLSDMGQSHSGESEESNDSGSTGPVKVFQSLTLLDCSNCNLHCWNTQIRRLCHLPKLATLILDDNPITEASILNPDEFAQLEHIQITGNEINSWAAIESLAQLPNLKGLRFRKCPLTNEIGSGEARAGTIARLPQIELLNASDISEKERLEAERRYVSNVSREMILLNANTKVTEADEDSSSISNSFKKLGLYDKYPRFEELMAKHKESMLVSQSANMGGASISSNALSVTIRSMAAESCTIEPMQKRLPSSLKVGRLKIMCAKVFGLDIELQMLHFRSEVRLFLLCLYCLLFTHHFLTIYFHIRVMLSLLN
jgi:hypothetical protein